MTNRTHTVSAATRTSVLHKSLAHWHAEVKRAGRRSDRHATQRAVTNVQRIERKLGFAVSY